MTSQAKMRVFDLEIKLMAVRQPRYSKEEFDQRGDEIYQSQVRQQIDEEIDRGRIVGCEKSRLMQRRQNRC
jgi:hypothetical protein